MVPKAWIGGPTKGVHELEAGSGLKRTQILVKLVPRFHSLDP